MIIHSHLANIQIVLFDAIRRELGHFRELTSSKIMPNKDEEAKLGRRQEPHIRYLSIRQIFQNFLDNTTAHGCGRLAASRSMFWTSFWVILILGAHCTFYYHTYLLVKDYSEKATRTKISMHDRKKLDFPVVTVCNRNMLRRSKIGPELKKNIEYLVNITAEHEFEHATLSTPRPYLPKLGNKHRDITKDDSFKAIWSKYAKEDLIKMGHQLEDMLLDCSFEGQNCRNTNDSKTWGHIWIEGVGNCFMFNNARDEKGEKSQPHKQLFQGRQHGLKLMMNIEQDEYIEGITAVAGLRLFIGDHDEMPFPAYDGISIGPGLSTDIEIKMKHTIRLDPFKNNTCKASTKTNPSNIYNIYNISYSKKACEMSCYSHLIQTSCSCSLFEFSNNDSVSLCSSSDPCIVRCLDEVWSEFLDGTCDPSCPPPCFQVSFESIVSNSKWPANNYKTFLINSIRKETNLTLTEENVEGNLLELHVYYSNMDYVRVEEHLKYDFESLISDIGGQMGMWVGLSMLTIAELVEFIWKLMHSLGKKRERLANVGQTKGQDNVS